MSAVLPSPGARCPRHAMILATHVCNGCGNSVCDRCVLPQPDGTLLCRCCTDTLPPPDMASPGSVAPSYGPPSLSGGFPPPVSPYARFKCANHPEMESIARCSGCGAHVCSVCDFRVDSRHACPACVMKESGDISPKRRNLAIIGCVIAAWSTVAVGLVMSGFFASMVDDRGSMAALEAAMVFLCFLPSMIGYAVSMSAIERNQPNSTFLWVSAVWNMILLLGYLALSFIGIFS